MPKIITRIAIKEREDENARKLKKGVDPSPFYEDPYRRRFLDPRKYLNVYDLHRNSGGSDRQYISYGTLSVDAGPGPGSLAPGYTPFVSGLFGGRGWIYAFGLPNEDITPWNNYVLPGTADELPSSRMRITDLLDDYGITFDGIGAYEAVPGVGIAIPEDVTKYKGATATANAIKWNMIAQPHFPYWLDRTVTSSPAVAQKMTKLPSFSAPAETLVVDKSIDVFLAPGIYTTSGYSRDAPFTEPPFPYLPQTWIFNMGVGKTLPRADTIGNTDWDDMYSFVLSTGLLNPPATEAAKNYYFDYFHRDAGSAVFTMTSQLSDYSHPGGQPPSIINPGGQIERYPDHNNYVQTFASGWLEGSLMAMIRKHLGDGTFEWYYVWVNTGVWFGLNPHFLGNGTGNIFDF